MKSEYFNFLFNFNLYHLCSRKFERYEVIQEFKFLPPKALNFPMALHHFTAITSISILPLAAIPEAAKVVRAGFLVKYWV